MTGKRYSAQERSALLEEFANRTVGITSFAKTHGVSAATLYKWRSYKEDSAVSFVEITRTEATPTGVHLLLRVGGVQLDFEVLPDANWLAALVQKLQG